MLKKSQLQELEALAKAEGARAEVQGAPLAEAPLERAPAGKRITLGLRKPAQAPVQKTLPTGPVSRGPKRPAGGYPKLTAWSFSRYKDWLQCPLKAKFKHIDRMREPGSPAMQRGTTLHKLAEDFVMQRINYKALELGLQDSEREYGKPTKFREFLDLMKDASKRNPICEESWGFRSDWTETGWFGQDTWCRVKLDLAFRPKPKVLCVTDHKTGKPYEDHVDQLDLYAVAGFVKFPDVNTILSTIWYLDDASCTELEFTRDQFPELKDGWNRRVAPMMNDTMYPAKPNPKCQWCHFRKGNGGPCGW